MDDTTLAVSAFSTEPELVSLPIERGAPLNHLFYPVRTLCDEYPDSLRVAQAGPSLERILLVETYLIVIAQGDCHASLGVLSAPLMDNRFGEDHNLACLTQLYGSSQAGHAAADHKEVGLFAIPFHPHVCSCTKRLARRTKIASSQLYRRKAMEAGSQIIPRPSPEGCYV